MSDRTIEIPVEDDAGHPAGPEDSWQESFAVTWYDPQSRVGGHFHTGLQRNRGLADYWSHVAVDGRIVAHELAITAPTWEGDYPNLNLGPLAISGVEPLRSYRVQATYDDVVCDVTYEAYPGPVLGYKMDSSGAAIAKGHFESYGRVKGTVDIDGRRIDFKGMGFHDHSWGSREYGSLLGMRNLMVNFGPDLYIQTFDCTTPGGRSVFGHIYADGEHQALVGITGKTEIADDGWTPLGIDMTLWTENGRGYRVTGVSDCTTYNVGWADTLRGVGYLRCELGGRVGGGQIWVGEMGQPAPWMNEALRTDFGGETS
jgi:hypothetical protein